LEICIKEVNISIKRLKKAEDIRQLEL